MRRFGLGYWAVMGVVLAGGAVVLGDEGSDAYLRGYVSAVVERDYGLGADSVGVEDGVVRVKVDSLAPAERGKMVEAVSRIRGVKMVEMVKAGAATQPIRGMDVVKSAAKEAGAVAVGPVVAPAAAISGDGEERKFGLFPVGHLFDPLMADQRWPDFSATYQAYQGNSRFQEMGAANFGGSLPIYRFETPGGGASEVGLQAGVFSLFNLDAESHDLVNADYFVALTDSYRVGDFSVMGRVWHNSSHLGDEFLLANPGVRRVNLSYEQVDVLFSYDLSKSWRVYGGPGYLFDQDPGDLEPWSVEYGVEWQSPWTFAGGTLRPVAGVDLQHHERENWDLDLSVRAGVQIEGKVMRGNKVQFLFEYYNGRNPNGQFFFDGNVQWFGAGLHWFF